MLLPITGEIRQKRPEETKLEFTEDLYKYIIDKQDRYIKKEYVSLDTNNLFGQSPDGTEFIWYYNGTAVSQQRGSISTLYYIRNIVHMRFYGSPVVTYGRYYLLPNNLINPEKNSIDVLYEQNTISIAVKELTEQSFQSAEGLKYHFMGNLLNGNDTSYKHIAQFFINTKPYSNGYFYFNKPINIINTLSIYFGNPFQKLVFPLYFNNFNILYTLNAINIYIDLYIPIFYYALASASSSLIITILNFTTTNPNNYTDANLITLINQEYNYNILVSTIIINGETFFILRTIVPYSGPVNYTPTGIPSNNVNCYIKIYRNIFNLEFSFIDDERLKNDFIELGISNILKRELYFRPERNFKTTKIILNSDYNISSFGSNYFQWNVNDFNQYITKNINTNDLIGNIIGIKFRNFSINSCFRYYPWYTNKIYNFNISSNLANKIIYLYIKEFISNFININFNYQGKSLAINEFKFDYTNNGYFWFNKIQQKLSTITLSMKLQYSLSGDEFTSINNDKLNFTNLIYYGFWNGPPPGYSSINPGCFYIINLSPFIIPEKLRNGNIKVYITNFTTANPVEDANIISIINSKNGIYGRLDNTLWYFIFPSIPYSSFYDPLTVQGNNLELYIPYYEFQIPIDIYQVKSEEDFIRSEYL
jgi:hypothetical protein